MEAKKFFVQIKRGALKGASYLCYLFFQDFYKKYPAPEGTGLQQSYSCGITLLAVGTQTVRECQ